MIVRFFLLLTLSKFIFMEDVSALRKKVKKYIDKADDTTVKMINAMFKVQEDNDWWDGLPKQSKANIDKALKELDNDKGIPHKKVKEMYPQWFVK